jgi:hypothetical protein
MGIEGTLTVQHLRRVDLVAVFTSIHRSSQKERSPTFSGSQLRAVALRK